MKTELLEQLKPLIQAFQSGKSVKEISEELDMNSRDLLILQKYFIQEGLLNLDRSILQQFLD